MSSVPSVVSAQPGSPSGLSVSEQSAIVASMTTPGSSQFLNLPWGKAVFADGDTLVAAATGAVMALGPDKTMAYSGECYSATGGSSVTTSQLIQGSAGVAVKIAAAAGAIPIVGSIVAIGAGLVGLFAALFKSKQQLAQAEQAVFCPAAAAAIDGWYAIQNAVNQGVIDPVTGIAGMQQLLADYSASPARSGTARMDSQNCTSFCILAVSIRAATLAQQQEWSDFPPSAPIVNQIMAAPTLAPITAQPELTPLLPSAVPQYAAVTAPDSIQPIVANALTLSPTLLLLAAGFLLLIILSR